MIEKSCFEFTNSIFEDPSWLDCVCKDSWNELYVKEGEDVIARLPYKFSKKGNKINIGMPLLTQTCGIWIKDTSELSKNDAKSFQKKAIYAIIDQLPKYKNFHISLDCNNSYVLPFIWKGFKVTPRFTYRFSNLDNVDEIYDLFSKTVKKNIKTATKKVKVNNELNSDILYNLMKITFNSQNRKYPIEKEMINKIVDFCKNTGKGTMLTAIDESNNIHASSLFIFDEKNFYYLIAGSNPDFRNSGAQSLILWEAIKIASKKSKVFDFEGSMIEGIETFFRRFNAESAVYYEITKMPIYSEILNTLKPHIKKLLKYK